MNTKPNVNAGECSPASPCSAGDDYIERRCIVCSDNVWWPRKSTLPPACGSHDYEEVFDASEEPNETVLESEDTQT